MKRLLALALWLPLAAYAWHHITADNYKTLQVVVNNDWTALPIMQLGSDDVLNVSFDELSHNFRRLVYELELCNPDWTTCDALFENDWLDGFNHMPIEDYENSINTTVLYTHYKLQIPNSSTRLKMSGNYRLHIIDEEDGEEVLAAEFRVVEPLMDVALTVTTNTDIDFNQSHQQVGMSIKFNGLHVTNVSEQIQTVVMQNGREDNQKTNVRPNYTITTGLTWEHNKSLIFEAGNEYRKFEVLDPSHPTMGLAYITWDEEGRHFHAFPFQAEPRRSYIYDVDADGSSVVRNSDNTEIDYTSDYVMVHYKMKTWRQYTDASIRIDGRWTVEEPDTYVMTYDDSDNSYNAVVMQKLGYYNYQLLMADYDGTTHLLPEEGSFYQTENTYTALVYFKGTAERSWRLVGMKSVKFSAK